MLDLLTPALGYTPREWRGGEAKARLVRQRGADRGSALPFRCDVVLGRLTRSERAAEFQPLGEPSAVAFVEEARGPSVRWWNWEAVTFAREEGATHVAVIIAGEPWFVGPIQGRAAAAVENTGIVRFGPSWLTLHLEAAPH